MRAYANEEGHGNQACYERTSKHTFSAGPFHFRRNNHEHETDIASFPSFRVWPGSCDRSSPLRRNERRLSRFRGKRVRCGNTGLATRSPSVSRSFASPFDNGGDGRWRRRRDSASRLLDTGTTPVGTGVSECRSIHERDLPDSGGCFVSGTIPRSAKPPFVLDERNRPSRSFRPIVVHDESGLHVRRRSSFPPPHQILPAGRTRRSSIRRSSRTTVFRFAYVLSSSPDFVLSPSRRAVRRGAVSLVSDSGRERTRPFHVFNGVLQKQVVVFELAFRTRNPTVVARCRTMIRLRIPSTGLGALAQMEADHITPWHGERPHGPRQLPDALQGLQPPQGREVRRP